MSSEKVQSNEEIVEEITKNLEEKLEEKCRLSEYETERHESGENKEETSTSDEETSSDDEEEKPGELNDNIDEEQLKESEKQLNEEEIEERKLKSTELKRQGNEEYKNEKYLESIVTYTEALKICPTKYNSERSILYGNRAASKINVGRKKSAIEDCTKSIELNDRYLRAYLRRAKLYEEEDKLDESLEDFKKVVEIDPGCKDALNALQRLPPKIQERNEKLKEEMLGKLKDLGNMILKPFGLSTNNFKLEQNPETGSYSVSMNKS
ncbi:tetratricopeptide repeat protein 1 [Coccinella septempunctata]|uniref:tetratricopeptide repeat protein 1 n=1 Tax=Coccinella septempunctata TaxID=41139 RepID=UPI001D07376C|nr:tetratricopeptide repeat protein 1 [Coccinella septempunctata]